MSKANQQDVSVLSAAKNGLVYLTPNDWALIADKAVRKQFKAGELIVQQGRRTHGVYLLVKGTALVKIPAQGAPFGIGSGETCGEISFLDELPATADVAAKDEVEAYYLDRTTLQSMFELLSPPGLALLSFPGRDSVAANAGVDWPGRAEADGLKGKRL